MRQDPEGTERQYLHGYAELAGARVLEIGTGDGRLLRRYQASAASVVAIDTRVERLNDARRHHADTLAGNVDFAASMGEALPFADRVFDGAIFAWSL
jgi:ubiquinone/menaquinone biosynthesis C-methylase UbiE